MRELIYGRQPVHEAMRAGRRQVFKLLLAREVKPSGIVGQVLALAASQKPVIPVQQVDRQALDKLGGEVYSRERPCVHQGLAAEVSGYPYVDLPALLAAARQADQDPFLLLLDHIQDPQNLGSLLRTAEAVGVHGAVIPGRRAAGVTPAAVRASAGAAEHVRVALVSNLAQALDWLKARGVWLAGLVALPNAKLFTQAGLLGPLGLVVGSEGEGLSRLVRDKCDFLIRLPLHGQVGSLNAAVAGAIALYEVRRQRDLK
jgi:23S rRNA (guanosine2251-2'-O)-methyltransferase